mgnify:CR=1 FL=1|jgi:tRNA U34 5-methylaminomethyl-2-thiouridine-forming methyltransferase MnmC
MAKTNYNQWDSKFLREHTFMAFGSLIKAYGDINYGKEVNLEQFKTDALELFKFSKELIRSALDESKELETQINSPTDEPEF